MNPVAGVRAILASEPFANLLLLVCRMLLAAPFLIFGVAKYLNQGRMMAYVERAGIPGEVLYFIIPYQVLSGLAILLGFKTRWAAFLLGGFCIVAPLLYHSNFSDPGELASFTKDFATAGGFAVLWLHGPGRFSFDAWFAGRRANAAGGRAAG
ncbi:MAG: DoxX family protein [Hyphomonadaceae bacterium]|nr:DoxX family protein [Hyphomonadaceae bacterium]